MFVNMAPIRIGWHLLAILVCIKISANSSNFSEFEDVKVTVNGSKILGNFSHFWESTGLSPPEPYQKADEFLLSKDMGLNFALIGALPTEAPMQVRIHWLLNLITVSVTGSDGVLYNFTDLDHLVSTCWRSGLKLGFELMGNPSNYFGDFENKSQIYEWRNLVKSVAKRYIVKYGLGYVRSWNFESWNEPDHGDFDGLNFTLQGFLNYYDACSEGLRMAHPSLRLGGPAESFRGKFINFSWGLLEHCVSGTNYFTGEQGVRLDFISMHQKGNGSSLNILNQELAVIDQIHDRLPSLKNVPIYDDEADPLVSWWRLEDWRADNTYAAMAVKVIGQHQEHLLRPLKSIRYQLLSNDNGFLNVLPALFEQRTLLARFLMDDRMSGVVQMVRKPIYSALGLLFLLGDQEVDARLLTGEPEAADVGVLATYHPCTHLSGARDSWSTSILFYNSADTTSSTSGNVNLTISIVNLTNLLDGCASWSKNVRLVQPMYMYVWYRMDNDVTNPYKVWQNAGSPRFPDQPCFQKMRATEEPRRLGKPLRIRHLKNLKFQKPLPQPGILLLHICQKSSKRPGKVNDVKVYQISNTDVLVTWRRAKVGTKCILTYEVQSSMNRTFHRLNLNDVIFHSYQHTFDQTYQGKVSVSFQVRAMDYWNRAGQWSAPVVV